MVDYASIDIERQKKAGILRTLATRIFPLHFLRQFRFELRMLLVRIRSVRAHRRFKNASNLLVNIGCGFAGRDGWVNIDCFNAGQVNCLFDVRRSLPFPDHSVKAIFTEHFFEHLDYLEEVPIFLNECYRVLQQGGVIRIIVPDAEPYLKSYVERDWEKLKQLRPLKHDLTDSWFGFRYNTQMELVNVVFRQYEEHKFAYDYETLEFLLKRVNFSSVIRQSFNRSASSEVCIDEKKRASESLYVEAIK